MPGSTTVEVLWPADDLDTTWSSNDCALVVRVCYAGHSILICGDIEEPAQRRLLARGGLKSDVLILPHHGAVVKSTKAFIGAVDPSIVIRSGSRRGEGGPAPVESLVAGRQYYDTASDGAVEITIRRDGVSARVPYKRLADIE
jgi:competence protein ComEC